MHPKATEISPVAGKQATEVVEESCFLRGALDSSTPTEELPEMAIIFPECRSRIGSLHAKVTNQETLQKIFQIAQQTLADLREGVGAAIA